MDIGLLLDMAVEGLGERVVVGSVDSGLTAAELSERAAVWAEGIEGCAVLVATNGPHVPVLLFAAARAGVPFVPLNYRLDDDRLQALAARLAPATAFVASDAKRRLSGVEGLTLFGLDGPEGAGASTSRPTPTEDAPAVLLFTSGTTGEPKAAVLRAEHLVSYVLGTVEFAGAGPEEATLVSVPPYHIAGISAVLSSVYAGRRLVYLDSFDPDQWVDVAAAEAITHAMVVPTMLRRLIPVLEARPGGLPHLRQLAYGGGPMPRPVIARAMDLLPAVDFVNAYGLTETASTIAVLDAEDHRRAATGDPVAAGRLGSVGRATPAVEIEIRDRDGSPLGPGELGEIHVRGPQVAGEYRETGQRLTEGWFPTRDAGWVDEDGYLFLDGRLDDVIVRGGENISPGEVEACLLEHPAVVDAAVVGVPDEEWGEAVAAAVVLAPGQSAAAGDLQAWVRERLRSSKTPSRVAVLDSLPYNETGKLLRRQVRANLGDGGTR